MKKKHVILIASAILMVIVVLISLCLNALGFGMLGMLVKKPNINEIDSEQLLQVKQAYLDMKKEEGYLSNMTVGDVYVEEYCGSYDGCIVMMFSHNGSIYAQAIRMVSVAGVRIRYSDANVIYAWKNYKMYTLEQAHAAGILSRSDIKNIRNIHNQY